MIDARQRRLARLADVSQWCEVLSPFKGARRLRRILWELDVERCDSVLEWRLRRKLREAGFRPDSKPARWLGAVGRRVRSPSRGWQSP